MLSVPTSAEEHEVSPLAQHLKQSDEHSEALERARVMFGSGLAMRLASEEAMASEVARLPGLPSSLVMKETVCGDIDRIDFSHLNVPADKPVAPRLSLHERAEAKFGI